MGIEGQPFLAEEIQLLNVEEKRQIKITFTAVSISDRIQRWMLKLNKLSLYKILIYGEKEFPERNPADITLTK